VKAYGLQSITNLIVRRKYGEGRTIALNAHGDVVPPGEGWTHGPTAARSWTARSTAARPR
jgi:succinyl-diaminopimelate desuccinylase